MTICLYYSSTVWENLGLFKLNSNNCWVLMYNLRKISLCHMETLNSKVVFTFSTHSHLWSLLYILQYGPKILKTLFHTFFALILLLFQQIAAKKLERYIAFGSFICLFPHSYVHVFILLSVSTFICPFLHSSVHLFHYSSC